MCETCSRRIPKPRRPDARYCSPACRQKAYRDRHRSTVPAELRGMDRWTRRAGKRPVTVTGRAASSTDSGTWASYSEAVSSSVGSGVGFMLGAGIGCIDIDDCVSADGTVSELAQEVLRLNPGAWVELSLSRTGLHVWGYMDEQRGRVADGLEVYSRSRFIALGTTYRAGGLHPLNVPELATA